MLRAIPVIVAAIQFGHPGIDDRDAAHYAKLLQQEAASRDFDPLTGVAIIHFESGFRPDVVSRNGEDHGLAQIRARYVGACAKDKDPVRRPSPECRAVKRMLLTPEGNIQKMGEIITRSRAFCKKKTGSALFARWLASYQGRNDVRKKRWCVPGEGTYRVINYRLTLIRHLKKLGMLRQ